MTDPCDAQGALGVQLYLVQHGAAKNEAEDPQRGLTEAGQTTVERMAEFMARLEVPLDRIEHSDKLRARQTAEILAARLRPTGGTREVGGMAPNDDVEPMRSRLETESRSLMLVGHLPYLSRLAARLLGLERDRVAIQFQMGGVVRLDREAAGYWAVRWALPPELLPPR
jgi:phosphohistidine phosphatase